MSLSKNAFATRVVAVPVVAVVASAFGAITSSWWAAALMGFLGVLIFTAVSERVLRGMLFGKLGGGVGSAYFVQLVGETITLALIGLLFSAVFGAAIANSLSFWVAAGVTWFICSYEMITRIPGIFALWLATRR